MSSTQDGTADSHKSLIHASVLDEDIAREHLQQVETLIDQFATNGDKELLEQAAQYAYSSVKLLPNGSSERHNACSALGLAIFIRFQYDGDVVSLNEAIDWFREAVTLRPDGHPRLVGLCLNLIGALIGQYTLTEDARIFDEIVGICRRLLAISLSFTSDDVSQYSTAFGNLCRKIGKSLVRYD
jgi:hypothetical protein